MKRECTKKQKQLWGENGKGKSKKNSIRKRENSIFGSTAVWTLLIFGGTAHCGEENFPGKRGKILISQGQKTSKEKRWGNKFPGAGG